MRRVVGVRLTLPWRGVSSQVSVSSKETSAEVPIVIPKRIQRGPTDILKALASTIQRDYTAPHYKYHDDPFFIPAGNPAKRSFALSKESGRKTAKFFLEKYPDSFANNPAVPNVPAFNPPTKVFNEETECSEDDLKSCIQATRINDSVTIYQNLKAKDTLISDETLLNLLELLTFYNCKEPLAEDLFEERWVYKQEGRDTKRTWVGGLSEEVFERIKDKDARAMSAMVQGMAKHYEAKKACGYYGQMKENGFTPSVHAFNNLISCSLFLHEGFEQRWTFVKEILTDMKIVGVSPTLITFNNALEVCSRFGSQASGKQHSLAILAEMRHLGIEPSLATFYFMLSIFCRDKGPVSYILHDIMEIIKDKEFIVQDVRDVMFFVTAMEVCHNHLMDKELAYKVHELLEANYHMMGDAIKESVYYQNLFKLLSATETVDKLMELYNKYVPNLYTPEPSVLQDILEAIDIHKTPRYLPQLWSDIIVFGHAERDRIVAAVVHLTATLNPEDPNLQKQFVTIANDVMQRADEATKSERRQFGKAFEWNAKMLADIITTCIIGGDMAGAWRALRKLYEDQQTIIGYPKVEPLRLFVETALEQGDHDKAFYCAKYATDLAYQEVAEFMKDNAEKYKLSPDFLTKVSTLTESPLADNSKTT